MRDLLLVAVALVCSCGGGSPADVPLLGPVATEGAPLANGIYLVKEETPAMGPLPPAKGPHERVLRYDPRAADPLSREIPRHVRIATSTFVPLVTMEEPELSASEDGKNLIHVALAAEHAKKLEDFTRANVGGRVVVILGGDVVSLHKVREAIVGGRMQITRCTDRACQKIKTKLLEAK